MGQAHYYEVGLDWTEGRIGKLHSSALNDEVSVATPPEFAKGVAGIWSPEHLFVAAVNSCLMTTFLAIAENFKLQFSEFNSKAAGKLEIVEGNYQMSEVILRPVLTIGDELDMEKGMKILQKAERACLISNSIKSKIIFEPRVQIAN